MSANFDKASEELIRLREGDYANHPKDPGGKTRWGITEAVARNHGYRGEMEELPLDFAVAIYKESYWPDLFDALSYTLSYQLFDSNVNHGVHATARMAQQVVRVRVDGIMGPVTSDALKRVDEKYFIAVFNAKRLRLMRDLKHWDAFSRGWVLRIAENLEMMPWTG